MLFKHMKNTKPLKIHVILASTRSNRFGDKPANWIFEEAKKAPGIQAELIDLKDLGLPFFDEVAGPANIDGKYKTPGAAAWAAKIGEADGFIIVTPEYNHGYPAALKNALDYAYAEWNRKPVAFVAYGSVAGARAVEQLRQVAVELQMAPVRKAVHIQNFWTLVDEAGKLKENAFAPNAHDAADMLSHLIWWAGALRDAREGA